ncbi:MAG: hypothetical protein U0744_05805 [Gemmataceae bacterium]
MTITPPFQNSKPRGFCASELGDAIGDAIAVVVMEDDQSIGLLFERFPFRIRRPNGSPQPAFVVELELHRIRDLAGIVFRRRTT